MEGRPVIAPTLIISAILVQAVTLFAWAEPGKPEKPAPPEKVKAEVSAKKIKGPKRNGKAGREFPVMFDIAGKAKAAKSKRPHAPKR